MTYVIVDEDGEILRRHVDHVRRRLEGEDVLSSDSANKREAREKKQQNGTTKNNKLY